RADYVPGDKVTLHVKTTDDTGKPVSAMVGLTVTDSSVLEMIEKREQAPRLPVMVLLENEVQNLADAHVYLDENNPKAPLATDLLLGTQGWRRFATAGTGSLNGSVTDAINARIPGVAVRAMNTATGEVLTTVTNESGAYAFFKVKAGTYRMSASLPGFQTMTLGSQVVHDHSVRQDFQLAVAPVNEMLMVQAAAVAGVRGRQGQQGQQGQFVPPLAAPAPPPPGLPDLLQAPIDAQKNVQVQQLQGQQGQGGGAGFGFGQAKALADRAFRRANIVTVREYAHTLRPNWTEGSRVDFAETVYWNAGVKTDTAGLATVSFNLSDSVTSFRALADAFGRDGTLGSNISEISSVQPFSIEPKIPLQVTSGDVIQLPIGMINEIGRAHV